MVPAKKLGPIVLLSSSIQHHVSRHNLLSLRFHSVPPSNAHLPDIASCNALLLRYARSHQIDGAIELLNAMPHADARSWNTVISGLIRSHRPDEAIAYFVRMTRSAVRPDDFSYSTIIPCCDQFTGKQVHANILKSSSLSDAFVGTNLMKMYAGAGEIGNARKVFDEMPEKDSVSWNVMFSCYSKCGMGDSCVEMFRQMVREGMRLDEFTFAIVLNELVSRSMVFEGMQVHSLLMRNGLCSDRFACNSLLNLYCKWGFMGSAGRLFEDMADRDMVSWTVLIAGIVESGYERVALETFGRMRAALVEPNSFTFGSLISCCANANLLELGRQFHALVLKCGLKADVIIGSSIVSMYSKCGDMDAALRIFRNLPERDLVSWNVIICGLAQNGEASKALHLFEEMKESRQTSVKPNHVTFVGILTACSHGGLVEKGCVFFSEMVNKYSIEPLPEHYACIVDMLARVGFLEEAEKIILALPVKPDAVIWGALLAACRRHGNLVMAKRTSEGLFADELTDSSNYVLLANTYADMGEWNDALKIREVMCADGSKKMAGSSWVEIKGHIHSFSSGDNNNIADRLIIEELQILWLHMLDEGYESYDCT